VVGGALQERLALGVTAMAVVKRGEAVEGGADVGVALLPASTTGDHVDCPLGGKTCR